AAVPCVGGQVSLAPQAFHMFSTQITLIVRDDLAVWQKLNVTAFLTSGIIGAAPDILGAPYEDAAGNSYHALAIQPMIMLVADAETIKAIYRRAMERKVPLSLYISDMFTTGHDAANRAAGRQHVPDGLDIVGLGLPHQREIVA